MIYPPGHTLTQFDMLRECPFPNTASLISIKGKDLREALEQALRKLPARAGCFPQVSGLRIKLDLTRPSGTKFEEWKAKDFVNSPFVSGSRIVSVQTEGKDKSWSDLDNERMYKCGVTEFIRNGGDGLEGFTRGEVLKQKAGLLSNVVAEYIKRKREVSPTVEGRVVVL